MEKMETLLLFRVKNREYFYFFAYMVHGQNLTRLVRTSIMNLSRGNPPNFGRNAAGRVSGNFNLFFLWTVSTRSVEDQRGEYMKKRIIIGILVAVLAVGAGSAGFYRYNQVQEQKAVAIAKEKEETARFAKLKSEYDTALSEVGQSLYPNADGMIPDDAAMDQSKAAKEAELTPYLDKIKKKSLTKKEEAAFHALTDSIEKTYQASKTTTDNLYAEVTKTDPNTYGTYYTDANKTDVTNNLSSYTDAEKKGDYRTAYSALTKVQATYASVASAKQQAEEQAAAAAKKAEEERQVAAQKTAEQKAAAKKQGSGSSSAQKNTSASAKSKSTVGSNSSASESASQGSNNGSNQMSDEELQALYKWERDSKAAAQAESQRLANETGRAVISRGGPGNWHYYYYDTGELIK